MGETEKEPELEGAQPPEEPGRCLGNQTPDKLWPTLSNPNPSHVITKLSLSLVSFFPFGIRCLFHCPSGVQSTGEKEVSGWSGAILVSTLHIPQIFPTAGFKTVTHVHVFIPHTQRDEG